MKIKLALCAAAFPLLVCARLKPQHDKNISISSANSTYTFVFNPKTYSVEIKEEITTNYTCNNYRESVPIVEAYNDRETIDNVSFKVDKRTPQGVEPLYTYYKVNDVFYSDERLCTFMLPLDKQGSTGVVSFKKTVTDPRFFTEVFFTDEYHIDQKEVVIKVPRWMQVELLDMNFKDFHIQKAVDYDEKSDMDIYTYTADDLPADEHERHTPGPTHIFPHIFVRALSAKAGGVTYTFFNTLADQYKWYKSITKLIHNNDTVIRAKAQEIVKNCKTDLDKIKAVYYWVQGNIHYIAFEDGLAGFKPANADEVLRKNYGDCKGMANLNKALLKALGFDARLCWLGTKHIAYNYNTPSLAVDNHMICAVMLGGKTYFLDATESYMAFNEFAERIQGRQVLIENGDQYVLTNIPSVPLTQNLDYEKRTLSIAGTELQGNAEHVWKGEEKETLLSSINGTRKDKLNSELNTYLSDGNGNYTISNLKLSDFTDVDKDFTASCTINFKNGVNKFGKDYYIDLDLRKEFSGFNIDPKERRYDYDMYYRYNINRETIINIPAGFKVSTLPAPLTIKNKNYEFVLQYEVKNNQVVYHKTMLMKNTLITKSEFTQWDADIASLNKAYNQQLVLTQL